MRTDKKNINQIMKGLQWSSGIAVLISGILLVATFVQIKIHEPIINTDFSNVRQLIERNQSDQNLKEEFRTLDMLARKAYFTSTHQLNTGTTIFFIALAIFLISWNIRSALSPPLPVNPGQKASWWGRQTRSAKTAAAASAVIIAIIMICGILHRYSSTSTITLRRDAILENEDFSRWWMNFRGPGGIGVAVSANTPVKFDGETMAGIGWKVETPLEGFSSPVVYDNKVFLTGGTKESRQIFCFDVDDGKLLWTYNVKVPGVEKVQIPKVDKETGYAAPTVACDGKNVYAIFATGELVALTLKGKPVWPKFLGVPDNHYGHSSSLITHNGLLFVQFDQYDAGKLFAIDGKNGKVIWEAPRTILSWGSPICVNTGNRQELVLVDNEYVTSYNPMNGKILWSVDCLHGEVGPSAAFASGMVFAANEYAVAAGINLSGVSDADGKLTTSWEVRGGLPNTASPVSIDSLLFLATSTGTVTCLDNRDGNILWTHEFDRGFYSSPVIAGNNVFLFDRDGVMHVFAVSAEFTLIGSSSLGEPVVTTPAILDGYMIIRGDKYLYRIDGI